MTSYYFKTALLSVFSSLIFGSEAVISQRQFQTRSGGARGKLYGGSSAKHGGDKGHPYLVSLQYLRHWDDTGNYYMPFCGGAILDSRTILTAAHCFDFKPRCLAYDPENCYRVVAGRYDDGKNGLMVEQTRFVDERVGIRKHGNYSEGDSSYEGDLAIIKLYTPLRFNNYVRPISVIGEGVEFNRTGVIAGWGAVAPGADGDVLQEAAVEILSDEECDSKWGKDYNNETMICAGGVDGVNKDGVVVDPCWGDSGGPLVTTDVNNPSRKYVIGVISAGHSECGDERYPALYTNLLNESYREWIGKFVVKRKRSKRGRRVRNNLFGVVVGNSE